MDPAHPAAKPVFSQMLRERLIEDACLRAHASQLRGNLEAARAAADQAKRDSRWFRRLLAAVTHPGKTGHPPAELARIAAGEKEAQRQLSEIEQILQRHTTDLDTLITLHLRETMPVFHEYSVARTRLAGWEGTVQTLRTEVRGLLKTLGQARGSATSGYNKSKHTITATAQEAFNKAFESARSVEARIKLANGQAQELGGLPGVAVLSCENAIKSLPGLDIGAMQEEFSRLTKELEAFEAEQLANLMEPAVEAAVGREEQARAYVENYRGELRGYSDRLMQPGEMARAVPAILARQARR